jgi:hypothetical protein
MSEAAEDLHHRLDQLRLLASETDDSLAERLVRDMIIELESLLTGNLKRPSEASEGQPSAGVCRDGMKGGGSPSLPVCRPGRIQDPPMQHCAIGPDRARHFWQRR